MQQPSQPAPEPPTYLRPLADGGTITLDGSTPRPETGQPRAGRRPPPAGLPAWRLRDLATTLTHWSTTVDALTDHHDWPPDEADISRAVTAGARPPGAAHRQRTLAAIGRCSRSRGHWSRPVDIQEAVRHHKSDRGDHHEH